MAKIYFDIDPTAAFLFPPPPAKQIAITSHGSPMLVIIEGFLGGRVARAIDMWV
jgi:hypothetical protein